jgi:hypothetical protein
MGGLAEEAKLEGDTLSLDTRSSNSEHDNPRFLLDTLCSENDNPGF